MYYLRHNGDSIFIFEMACDRHLVDEEAISFMKAFRHTTVTGKAALLKGHSSCLLVRIAVGQRKRLYINELQANPPRRQKLHSNAWPETSAVTSCRWRWLPTVDMSGMTHRAALYAARPQCLIRPLSSSPRYCLEESRD